jgi:hypothetical protein
MSRIKLILGTDTLINYYKWFKLLPSERFISIEMFIEVYCSGWSSTSVSEILQPTKKYLLN